VLGTLPLLWNAVKSIWIRQRLHSAIPSNIRDHFSLGIDLAAGVVPIVLDNLVLKRRNLLANVETMASLAPRKVVVADSRLPDAAWVGLLATGLPVEREWDENVQRLVVDSTLRLGADGIKCHFRTFAFFCLGLGIDLYRGGLCDLASSTINVLRAPSGRELAVIKCDETWRVRFVKSQRLIPFVDFSERRALAQMSIMLVACHPTNESFLFDANGKSYPRSPTALRYRTIRAALVDVEGGGGTFTAAFTWTLYAESVFYESELTELLHVPQFVLRERSIALFDLRRLGERTVRAIIEPIFGSNCSPMEDLMARVGRALEYHECGRLSPLQRRTSMSYDDLGVRTYSRELNILYDDRFRQELIRDLKEQFHFMSHLRKNHDLDLALLNTPAAICARIIMAVSVVQRWPRADRSPEIDPNLSDIGNNSRDGTSYEWYNPMPEGYAFDIVQPKPNPLIELFADADLMNRAVYIQ